MDEIAIPLERWVVLERLRLDEFAASWRQGMKGDSPNGVPIEAFPAKMPIEEWDEQYRSGGGA